MLSAAHPRSRITPATVTWSGDGHLVACFPIVMAPADRDEARALLWTLHARIGAIRGDTPEVDAFAHWCLGITKTDPEWREAVSMALMQDCFHDYLDGRTTVVDLLRTLKREAATFHQQQQPLWERKVRGRRLQLLDTRVASGLTLGDLISDKRLSEPDFLATELTDQRIVTVLRDLRPDETAVALAWMQTDGITWAEAAASVCAPEPAALGDRVRRKLRRLGRRHSERAIAARVVR
ncbi:hypothetical protein ACLF6K_04850 [Streptomyces xanthophaeus]|uniref:hypothetical protein n=1 Tax=Streptomyces xanthophaeus TaxID=67385 RepID=UPI00398FFCD4